LLVIHGDADPLLPVQCGIDTAEAVAGSKLKIIEGMGHALPVPVWRDIIDAVAAHAK
jgi:pimeloyl-ACP methyl ester carboxylesterase